VDLGLLSLAASHCDCLLSKGSDKWLYW
jgi:hypothetical protein